MPAHAPRAQLAQALSRIYNHPYRPPEWATGWAGTPAFEPLAQAARAFTLDERAAEVAQVLREREPVNIGMSRLFDAPALQAAFGWRRSGYFSQYAASERAGQPVLPPNLAVFTRTPVGGAEGPQVDVLNVTGFAFDSFAQPDHRYFVHGGRLGELRPRLVDVFRLVFACARHRARSTVVLALVGGGAFSAGFPGGSRAYLRDHFFPALAQAWRGLPQAARPSRLGLLGSPAALPRVAEACPGAQVFGAGLVPKALYEHPEALFVNAWDPHSVVGNGNAADASLDGYFGRNTAMQFLSLPAINPWLQVLGPAEVGALLS